MDSEPSRFHRWAEWSLTLAEVVFTASASATYAVWHMFKIWGFLVFYFFFSLESQLHWQRMSSVLTSEKTNKKPYIAKIWRWKHIEVTVMKYFDFGMWSPWFLKYMDISERNKFPGDLHSLRFILLLLLLLSCFSCVRLCATLETTARQAPHPWDSSGKNIGMGCHFLLQGSF